MSPKKVSSRAAHVFAVLVTGATNAARRRGEGAVHLSAHGFSPRCRTLLTPHFCWIFPAGSRGPAAAGIWLCDPRTDERHPLRRILVRTTMVRGTACHVQETCWFSDLFLGRGVLAPFHMRANKWPF